VPICVCVLNSQILVGQKVDDVSSPRIGREERNASIIDHDKDMADDEMMLVDDEPILPSKNKGKGKAVETVDSEDNLPW
jgi:hypothetical protein